MIKRYSAKFVSTGLLAIGLWTSAWAMEPVALNQRPVLANAWAYTLDGSGRDWFAYYADEDSALYVRRPDGSEAALSTRNRERYQSGIAIAATGQDLAVLWRDKLPEKTLYFLPALGPAGSTPQPLVAGSQESEPLTRMHVGQRDRVTYLLWLGEKGQWDDQSQQNKEEKARDKQPTQPYHLYFRYTEDGGKTFSNVEQVLPGLYPAWILDKEVIPVFSRTDFDGQLVMVMRIFDRASKKFGPPVKIADASVIEPVLEAFESSGRWFLLWIGRNGEDVKTALLQGVFSDDQGQTWKHFKFESLQGLNFSRLDTASDGQGHILISVSGNWKFRDDNSRAKDDVYVIRSTDNGTTWSEPQQPRAADLRQYQARYPAAVFGAKPGSAMLIWEDWRAILPNVYVQFSTDYGASWSDEIPLDRVPVSGYGLDFKNKTAWAVGDRYQILTARYRDSGMSASDMVRYQFTAQELQQQVKSGANPPDLAKKLSEAHLRERVGKYWNAMQEQDWATSYAINDPFFRGKVKYDDYRSNRGRIKHLSHEILEITQQGNIAKVRIRFDAEVPEFLIHGKPVSKPRESYETTDTWLFIHDDWYREYYDQVQDIRFTNY